MRALPSLRFLATLALCTIATCAVGCTDDDDDDPPDGADHNGHTPCRADAVIPLVADAPR
jgi:hypothetical protein